MNYSGLERPPDGIDMFIYDRPQQMEREAVRTTYCKRRRMAEWNRWGELLRGERKDFRVKKIKCMYREEGRWRVMWEIFSSPMLLGDVRRFNGSQERANLFTLKFKSHKVPFSLNKLGLFQSMKYCFSSLACGFKSQFYVIFSLWLEQVWVEWLSASLPAKPINLLLSLDVITKIYSF